MVTHPVMPVCGGRGRGITDFEALCYFAVTYLAQGQCDTYSKIPSQKKKQKSRFCTSYSAQRLLKATFSLSFKITSE